MRGPLISVNCDQCGASLLFPSGGRVAPDPCLCPVCSSHWVAGERKLVAQVLRRAATIVRQQVRRVPATDSDVRGDLLAVADELLKASRAARIS